MKTLYLCGLSEYGVSYRSADNSVEMSSSCDMEDCSVQTVTLHIDGEASGLLDYDAPKIMKCKMFDALNAYQFQANVRDAAEKFGYRVSNKPYQMGDSYE